MLGESTIRKTTTTVLRFAQCLVTPTERVSVALLDGDDAAADGELHQFGRALEPERLQDAGLVCLRRAHGNLQHGRNFFGGTTLRNELQDFTLTHREPRRRIARLCFAGAV